MKIVLTGGAGLVGQNLALRLHSNGYRSITVVDKHAKNAAVQRHLLPDIEVRVADVAASGDWEQCMADADAVVMLHAQIGARETEPFWRNNVHATKNVLGAMREHSVPYLVHVSSSVVESVAEDAYTKSKKEQEALVRNSGIAQITLRPTLMFGWFDRKHLGWLAQFMRRVPVFPIPGDGRYPRQPLYVGDFCSIIEQCLARRVTGGPYNISGLEFVDYIDIIRTIRDTIGVSTPLVRIPYKLFHALLRTWVLFDPNPPFTATQLEALVAGDEFEIIDWPGIFNVTPTPFREGIEMAFAHPEYSQIRLEF